ncbi:MAG TPA: PIN domain-containing protein [Nitrososphaerales archaeon]|nr:PIN domain-containing protein [Nitrososphaerales archaeon]
MNEYEGTSYDTRFLVELYYSSNTNQQLAIKKILLGSKPNYLSTAALSELYKLSLEKEGKDVAELRAKSLVKDFHLVDVNQEIAIGAALIKHKHSIPFADSIIASTAKVLKVPCYTDDPHFESVEGVIVKWIR